MHLEVLLLIMAALYGVTMKIADLLNEHGLRWCKGDAIFFGVLWGIAGMILILISTRTAPVVVSAIVAMNVAFLARGRLDYINHQVAGAIIISFGIWSHSILDGPFAFFLLVFVVFGGTKDYLDDVAHSKSCIAKFFELGPSYPISTFLYCLIYGDWLLFWVFTLYIVCYVITVAVARRYGYP